MGIASFFGYSSYSTVNDLRNTVIAAREKGDCDYSERNGVSTRTQSFTFRNPTSVNKVESVISRLWLSSIWSISPVFRGVLSAPLTSTKILPASQPDVLVVEFSTNHQGSLLTINRLNRSGSGEGAFTRI